MASKLNKVAIIGAGPSGLAAAKNVKMQGLEPTVFDRSQYIGGLWAPDSGATWETMHTNVSKYFVSLGGYRWPKGAPLFPTRNQVFQYFTSYAKHYDLESHIKLNSNVEKIKQLDNSKKWQICFRNTKTNELIEEEFGYVIIAIGLHQCPNYPRMENSEEFQGQLVHSNEFGHKFENMKVKRVLVVGSSLSAIDLAAHLVGHAKSPVVNALRRSYLILPRILHYKAKDASNKYHIVPMDQFIHTRNFFQTLEREIKETKRLDTLAELCPQQMDKETAPPALYYDVNVTCDEPPRVIVGDYYMQYVINGKIKAKQTTIKRFAKEGVLLDDGSFEQVDVVLFCTGYKLNYDFFEPDVLEKLEFSTSEHRYKRPFVLYKNTFHPHFENLAFVWQMDGLFYPCSDLQAKWISLVFSGKVNAPSMQVMEEEIAKENKNNEKAASFQYPYGEYAKIFDGLLDEIGVLSQLKEKAESDPKFKRYFYENTLISSHAQYEEDPECFATLMREMHELKEKTYSFTDEELKNPTPRVLAEKLSQFYNVPTQIYANESLIN